MPTATAEQVVTATAMVSTYAQATEQAKQQTAAAVEAAWLAFTAWYSTTAVTALGDEMAALSTAVQDVTAGMSTQYVAAVTSLATGRPATFPRTPPRPVVRNGMDLRVVHRRPAETYRKAIATGADERDARVRAAVRATGLLRSDTALAERAAAHLQLERMGITQFRRVVHPELSESGSCGLCIAAADNVYSTGDLMPIHPPHCKCTVMPIVGEWDPGAQVNENDLASYAAVGGLADSTGPRGGTTRADLSNVRVMVDSHGEFGPYLRNADHLFRGPGSVALEDDPERADRMLAQVLSVLERMRSEGRPAEVLDYQERLAARLQAIAA